MKFQKQIAGENASVRTTSREVNLKRRWTMSRPDSKFRFVEIVCTSKSNKKLKAVLETVNEELKSRGLPSIEAIWKTNDRKRYGYTTHDILEEPEFKLVDRTVKKHLKKLKGK
ncbi:MAG: hypothetical protein HYY86_00400 [Candidatus Harrisonbacteria bacterium]|nr:hypothetical protein [Candidatus Harrisonbacteria bacterium]